MASVFIPGRVVSMNEIVALRASWRGAYSKAKREYEAVALPLIKAELPPVKRADISMLIVEPHARRDPDGICSGASKMLCDALVEAGVIPDDGHECVASLSFRWAVNPDEPGVWLSVTEARD